MLKLNEGDCAIAGAGIAVTVAAPSTSAIIAARPLFLRVERTWVMGVSFWGLFLRRRV
jgi:hypothetical protein